jgi:hypothetical protein
MLAWSWIRQIQLIALELMGQKLKDKFPILDWVMDKHYLISKDNKLFTFTIALLIHKTYLAWIAHTLVVKMFHKVMLIHSFQTFKYSTIW